MKFDEFWNLITRELSSSRIFHTLKQSKEFEARYSGGMIIVVPETRYKRPISKAEFEKVWNMFKKSMNPYKPVLYQQDTYNASYILAIIKYFLKNERVE